MMMRAPTFLQQKANTHCPPPNTRCFFDVPICSVYGVLTYILVYKSMVRLGKYSMYGAYEVASISQKIRGARWQLHDHHDGQGKPLNRSARLGSATTPN